jgi:hypothetical protein
MGGNNWIGADHSRIVEFVNDGVPVRPGNGSSRRSSPALSYSFDKFVREQILDMLWKSEANKLPAPR